MAGRSSLWDSVQPRRPQQIQLGIPRTDIIQDSNMTSHGQAAARKCAPCLFRSARHRPVES
jgi:hypothetical protein